MKIHGGSVLLCAALLGGCAAPTTQRVAVSDAATQAEAARQTEMAVQDTVADQKRLSHVYWTLSRRGSALCGEHVGPHLGAFTMSKPKGEFAAAYERLYGIDDRPTVLFVEEGGPAQQAGLAPRDVVLGINGVSTDDRNALNELRKTLPPDQPLRLSVRRGKETLPLTVQPVKGCRFDAMVVPAQDINAYADGERVFVARGMMGFARDDRELALVVSHEMAHNVMAHLEARKKNMGLGFLADLAVVLLTRGQVSNTNFAGLGAGAYSQEFEAEADYVGLYMMAEAGLPIDDAPTFWRRMASAHPASIRTNHAASHPSTAYRMVALEEAVKEIKAKQAAGQPLQPNMKDRQLSPPAANPAPGATSAPAAAPAQAQPPQ